MNPDSLCAKCAYLIKGVKWHTCYFRNSMQQKYCCVTIEKGFKSCTNFKPKEENQQ